jgi:hypothetical protein
VPDDLPAEAEKLLAVAPAEFVAERNRLAEELRDSGRSAEAATVARIPKPSAVVLAVNRAARSRPKAAGAAADAALRVRKTQVGGDPEAFRKARAELEESLELLADVAEAHVASPGKRPSEAMRRRVRDLLRNAVADDEAREALRRGVLATETETSGFALFAGVVPAPGPRKRGTAAASSDDAQTVRRCERERALRDDLARAEQELKEAERSAQQAERERAVAERAVASLRAKLEKL